MILAENGMERRLRISGVLLIAALLVQAVSLLWSHPAAFLFFLFGGGSLMATGVLVYLNSLVSSADSAQG